MKNKKPVSMQKSNNLGTSMQKQDLDTNKSSYIEEFKICTYHKNVKTADDAENCPVCKMMNNL